MLSPLYFGKISSLHYNTHFVSQTLYMGRIKKSYLISSKVKFCLRRLRLRRGGSFCFGEVQVLSRRHLEHGRSRVRRMSKQVLLGRRRWSPVRSDISKKLFIVHYVQGILKREFCLRRTTAIRMILTNPSSIFENPYKQFRQCG